MSVHCMSWVLKHSEATLGARLVLLVLADHAKDDGTAAWPAVATVAHEARVSPQAARAALRRLEAAGMIEATGKSKKGTTVYRVLMGEQVTRALPDEGRKLAASNGQVTCAEPSIEPSTSQSSPDGEGKVDEARAVFEHWQSAFDKPRASLTDGRRKKIKARLEEGYGVDRIQRAIDGCAGSEWHRANDHIGLTLICQSGEKLERFEAMPVPKAKSDADLSDERNREGRRKRLEELSR